MKLLLIGGSGALSGCTAEMAMQMGHEVWTVTRGLRPLPKGVHSLIADREQPIELLKALKSAGTSWDAAIDCVCRKPEHARIDLDALDGLTSRIVVVSTDSVYEPHHKQVPQAEETEYYMQGDNYGSQKRQMEQVFINHSAGRLTYTIFRPGHIFGPAFQLGCYPEQSRQKDLLWQIRSDTPMQLVGGGEFLIHPIYVDDLVLCMLDSINNKATYNEIFCIGGPEAVKNCAYYELLGELTGHPVTIETVALEGYLEKHPEYSGHLCDRCYSLAKLQASGVPLPQTSLREGLSRQIAWLDKQFRSVPLAE